jgi:hypothetical protein
MTTADLKNHQLPNNRLEVFKSNITKVDDNFFNCPLTLTNGDTMNIPMRNDGYIKATLLCTAGGKLFSNWYQNKQTKDLINALESDKENSKNKEILNAGIPVFKSIQVTKGRYGGSWIHPDLAIQLAQWISPQFAIKVSRWMRELLLFGNVELGQEKSNKELENKFQEQIKLLTQEKQQAIQEKETISRQLTSVTQNHNKMLKRRRRGVYEIGNVVYIMSHVAFTNQLQSKVLYLYNKNTKLK